MSSQRWVERHLGLSTRLASRAIHQFIKLAGSDGRRNSDASNCRIRTCCKKNRRRCFVACDRGLPPSFPRPEGFRVQSRTAVPSTSCLPLDCRCLLLRTFVLTSPIAKHKTPSSHATNADKRLRLQRHIAGAEAHPDNQSCSSSDANTCSSTGKRER